MPSCSPIRRKPTRTSTGPRDSTWYRQPVFGYAETSRPLAARHSATRCPAAPLQDRRWAVGPVGAVLAWGEGDDDEGGGSAELLVGGAEVERLDGVLVDAGGRDEGSRLGRGWSE